MNFYVASGSGYGVLGFGRSLFPSWDFLFSFKRLSYFLNWSILISIYRGTNQITIYFLCSAFLSPSDLSFDLLLVCCMTLSQHTTSLSLGEMGTRILASWALLRSKWKKVHETALKNCVTWHLNTILMMPEASCQSQVFPSPIMATINH